jgi:acetylornithine deacetylase/succinyl-diaminopimelate desuccinylase-like protein
MNPRLCLALAAAVAVLPRAVTSQTSHTLPPPAQQQLARDILKELVEINTVGDSGATPAALALAKRLRAGGFRSNEVSVVGPKPKKQNLVVRLRGRGNANPILFIAHLDVVEARPEDWSMDPFKLTERDGYFYGRGSFDIKDEAADLIANLLRLRREGYVPDRDIIVALTDDEEGGDYNGASWLTQQRPDLVRAAYVINTDAGGAQMQNGRRLRNPVQTSEKLYASYELEVTGPGGHSSLPPKSNTIYTLARGLDRLSRFDFPVRLTPTVRAFFQRLVGQVPDLVARDLVAVTREPPDPAAVARLSGVPMYNSSMRNTCVATMLQAGHAENALPQRARATVQCRLLPGDTPQQVRDTLIPVLADSAIHVTQLGQRQAAPESPLSPEVMGAVERVTQSMWPGVIVLPVMDPWSSDGRHFRLAGYPVYGISGVFYDIDDVRSHGKDERVSTQSFYEGVEFMYRLMKELTSNAQ